MSRGARNAINRLLAIALFGALLVVGIAAGVEAAAALTGAGSQLDPAIPYVAWWNDLAAVDLSEAALAALASGVIVVGLGLLALELWPRRRDHRSIVSEAEAGSAQLRLSSVQPYLADRLRTLDWVRDPGVRVKVREGAARVDARPLARRLAAEDDLDRARDLLASCVAEVGLEPERIAVTPRTDKKTLRVR